MMDFKFILFLTLYMVKAGKCIVYKSYKSRAINKTRKNVTSFYVIGKNIFYTFLYNLKTMSQHSVEKTVINNNKDFPGNDMTKIRLREALETSSVRINFSNL